LWTVAGVPVAGRVALAAAAIVLACAAAAVRQWRFAPRIRRRDGALLAVGVLVLLGSGALGVAGGTTGAALGCITTVGIGDALAVACTRAQRGGVPHAGARIRSP
jgi:hypothetical protein